MKFLSFLLFIFSFIACQSNIKGSKEVNIDSVKVAADTIPIFTTVQQDKLAKENAFRDSLWANTEYLDFDKVRINGKLPLITDSLALYSLLGKPSKIVKPDLDDICVSFFDSENFKYVKYGNSTVFELCGDTIVPRVFNFESTPQLFLKYGELFLNSKTTLKEIEKIYPKAVKFQYLTDIYEEGKFVTLSLRVTKGKNIDASWLLFFEKGKLIRIDYWMPC